MLFDLQSGKRRRVVQVVYTLLAASFLIGFVIFGIGGTGGGIGDLFGGGGGEAATGETQYQPSIDRAEKQLRQDPKDQSALLDLARYRYLSGIAQADQSDPANPQITDATREEWNLALDAWEKYLATNPPKPDAKVVQVATPLITAYAQLGAPEGGAETQRFILQQDPTAENYATLAFFLYSDGKLEEGDQAAGQAVARANGKQAKALEKQLDQLAKQAATIEKQAKAAGGQSATGETALQNPFGGLGSGGGTVPPTAP